MFGEEGQRFSKRFGHVSEPAEITIREDAPPDLRYAVVVIAEHDLNTYPSTLRDILCRVLRTRPDPNHWSEYPNIWGEVQELISHCDWFRVYDVIEAIYSHLAVDISPLHPRNMRSKSTNVFTRWVLVGNLLMGALRRGATMPWRAP